MPSVTWPNSVSARWPLFVSAAVMRRQRPGRLGAVSHAERRCNPQSTLAEGHESQAYPSDGGLGAIRGFQLSDDVLDVGLDGAQADDQ